MHDFGRANYAIEILRPQAGTADEHATDLRQDEDGPHIGRRDGSSVEDLDPVTILAHQPRQLLTEVPMDLGDVLRIGGPTGPDRPERLISDGAAGEKSPIRRKARLELRRANLQRRACVALDLGFADTNDRSKAGPSGSSRLFSDHRVSFVMVVPPFRMADNDSVCARIPEHFGADIPCEGAGGLDGTILAANSKASAADRNCARNQCGRNADEDVIRTCGGPGVLRYRHQFSELVG